MRLFKKDHKSYSLETELQTARTGSCWEATAVILVRNTSTKVVTRDEGVGPGVKHVQEVSWTRSPLRCEK